MTLLSEFLNPLVMPRGFHLLRRGSGYFLLCLFGVCGRFRFVGGIHGLVVRLLLLERRLVDLVAEFLEPLGSLERVNREVIPFFLVVGMAS